MIILIVIYLVGTAAPNHLLLTMLTDVEDRKEKNENILSFIEKRFNDYSYSCLLLTMLTDYNN